VAELAAKTVQDRFVGGAADADANQQSRKSTKTAEALAAAGSVASTTAAK
jgi:hypothetical protein